MRNLFMFVGFFFISAQALAAGGDGTPVHNLLITDLLCAKKGASQARILENHRESSVKIDDAICSLLDRKYTNVDRLPITASVRVTKERSILHPLGEVKIIELLNDARSSYQRIAYSESLSYDSLFSYTVTGTACTNAQNSEIFYEVSEQHQVRLPITDKACADFAAEYSNLDCAPVSAQFDSDKEFPPSHPQGIEKVTRVRNIRPLDYRCI